MNKKKQCQLYSAIMIAACIFMLAGCEADPRESFYQREKRAGNVADYSGMYSYEEYEMSVFADQPSEADEQMYFGIALQSNTMDLIPSPVKEICRKEAEGFAHAWLQCGYYRSRYNKEKMSVVQDKYDAFCDNNQKRKFFYRTITMNMEKWTKLIAMEGRPNDSL